MLSSKNKLDKFRNQMQSLDLDACLVNQTDEFQNEFLPNYSQRLQWLTNFSGSAGEVLITHNQACLLYTSPSPRDRQKSRMPSSA